MIKARHILILLSVVMLVSCTQDMSVGPQNGTKIKSETKWLLANSTDQKIHIVSHKQFDISGQLLKSDIYNESGSLVSQTVITYSSNLTVEEIKTFNNTGTPDIVINSYLIDLKGLITQKISKDSKGDTLAINRFDYDLKGNLVEETIYDKFGTLKSRTKFEYNFNDQGFVIGTRINDGIGGINQSRDTIIYKMDLRLVERIKYDSSGFLEIIYTYMYSPDGKVTKEIQTDKTGNILKKYSYEYAYFN